MWGSRSLQGREARLAECIRVDVEAGSVEYASPDDIITGKSLPVSRNGETREDHGEIDEEKDVY